MIIIASRATLFNDWDGNMHCFAAADIYQGHGYTGWAAHFWPPLYPVLIGLFAKVMPAYLAAKLISNIAAVLLLILVHRFVYHLTQNRLVASIAQLLLVTNYTFWSLSIQAENHMPDALFYTLAIFLLLKNLQSQARSRHLLIGIVCGLAGLCRYTSYALLPSFIITVFFFYPVRQAIIYGCTIIAGFIIVSSPWWAFNYMHNGSPFATWQYMNVGAGIFVTKENRWQWWWEGINAYNSVWDIFSHVPLLYIDNFLRNILISFYIIFYKGQVIGGMSTLAVLILIVYHYVQKQEWLLHTRVFLPLLVNLVFFIMLVSQAFVFGDVFISWRVLLVIYGAFAGYRLYTTTSFKLLYKGCLITVIILAACYDVALTHRDLNIYLSYERGLENNAGIVDALKTTDPQLSQKLVMCFHPARAYHLGSHYLMLPLYYTGNLQELVTYQHMSTRVKEHAPRYPVSINIENVKANYLIYDKMAATCLPQFSFLLQKGDPRIPRNFQLVYLSKQTAVYRIL